tara:strand:+ start:460 stop:1011 length:552 start_codon:yes stop_codon:yes gene_type:complete
MVDRKIQIRLRALKIALNEIDTAFQETKRDTFLELGFEYNIPYPETSQNKALYKKMDSIIRERQEILYYRIFCFSQVIYSLKEYLKKLLPEKKKKIESFFSDQIDGAIPIKDLANDLKHNPDKDMKFGFVVKSKKTEIVDRKIINTINYNFNWHYEGMDSLDYCKSIYKDIYKFIREEIDRSY